MAMTTATRDTTITTATSPSAEPPAAALAPQALLQLMWLASPALPVGGFAYSEGLESAVEAGRVTGEADAADWLLDQLHLSLARSELPVAAAAWRAWQAIEVHALVALNAWVGQTRESGEMKLQTEQMGRSLGEWLRHRDTADPRLAVLLALEPAPTWPVAFALAAWHTGAPLREGLLAMAFGWAENMVQAAMKAVPLGQAAGQRMLGRLAQAIPQAVDDALALPPEDRQAFAPMLAILSSRHESQYSRLFRS